MFCRKCGYKMPDDSIFCGKCGFNQKEQINRSSQSGETSSQNSSRPFHNSTSGSSKSMYFDHSTKAITNLVAGITVILIIMGVVTVFINVLIAELGNHSYRYRTVIDQVESIRNWNILLDVLMAGALLWRCYLTNKNHLRITGDVLDGVCCPPFGFTTTTVHDLNVEDITEVEAKNNYTLVVTQDKKYVFLIDDAKKASKIIYKKMHKKQ